MPAPVRVRVWDLPTRLFHWLLVLAVIAAVSTGQTGGGWMDWHGRIGLSILGLLVFRLVWGLLGSTYARFSYFLPTPAALRAYLRGDWQGAGHNPLGALAVFAMLGLLLAQAGVGLFANDDIAFRGPLFPLVGKAVSDRLAGWHQDLFNLLWPLLVLHVAAIAYYARRKRQDLLRPMLHGRAEVPAGTPAAQGGGPLGLAVALLIAGGVVWLAGSGWLAEQFAPPPPPAAPAPDW